MKVLGIETSCDETACAVVENGRNIMSTCIASQIDEHKLYGGVVPEIASRRHSENIVGVCEEALEKAGCKLNEIDAIAVTYAPGLIGALLVGVNFAKGLAFASGKPLIPVHHIKGHAAANYLAYPDLEAPYLCLIASGGHTLLADVRTYTDFSVIGGTLDDAAGEAFDKVARALGFPYPGGVYIDEAAKKGDKSKYRLPRPKTQNELDFSFSGLKTAVINLIHNSRQKSGNTADGRLSDNSAQPIDINALAACFQHTVCDIIREKILKAAEVTKHKKIALTGGVAANSGLREMAENLANQNGFTLYIPPLSLCGDNAAMIAAQGYYEYMAGNKACEGGATSLRGVTSLRGATCLRLNAYANMDF